MIGRLDFNTTGLLLFTSDGEMANRLMHPSAEIEREYAVRVLGEVTRDVIKNLLDGVELDDGLAKFSRVEAGGGEGANQWFHVTLAEGRYREVRRLWESQNLTVSRLSRIRFGPLTLPRTLRAGQWQELDAAALKALGVESEPASEKPPRERTNARRKTPRPTHTTQTKPKSKQ